MKQGYTFWLIGLPSSGKTTLAASVRARFDLVHLDSDEIRNFLTPKPDYSKDERKIVYRSFIYMCKLLNEAGCNVIISATANVKKYRKVARKTIKNYREIYIKCPVKICEERDVKGLYAKAKDRKIKTIPIKIVGKNEKYIMKKYRQADVFEPPKGEECDLKIDATEDKNISIEKLSEYIEKIINQGPIETETVF